MHLTPLLILDFLGIFVFALSGALAAARKQMDVFGYIVLGILTAVGGGTIRDLVLSTPVFWIERPTYILVAIVAAALVFAFPVRVGRRRDVLQWMDAFGLALFCVLGAWKALALTGSMIVAVTLGVVTAVGGGILRDVVSNEIPLILHREIYATAAILGAFVYCVCVSLGIVELVALLVGGSCALAVRGAALIFGWTLPVRQAK